MKRSPDALTPSKPASERGSCAAPPPVPRVDRLGTLTADQIAHFHQRGYVVVRGLIDLDTVRFATDTIDAYITEFPDDVQYEPEALRGKSRESLSPIQ